LIDAATIRNPVCIESDDSEIITAMNILIVSQYFWPENFRINILAGALNDAGCRVTILTGQPNYPDGKMIIFSKCRAWRVDLQIHLADYPIIRVPIVPRGEGGALRLSINYLSFIMTSILLDYWKLRKWEFDVQFVYGTSPFFQTFAGVFFRAVRRVPLILWVQDLGLESLSSTGYVRNQLVLDSVAGIVRWIYRRCDFVIVQSRSFVAHVAGLSGSAPVAYYPNFSDVEQDFDPTSTLDPVQLSSGFNVVFAGNVGTVRSVETILDAAERLMSAPDVNIVILGSDSRLGWMADQTEKRRLSNVHLLGRFELDAAVEALTRGDALPIGLKDNEGLNKTVPSKLSTYLGVGKPTCVHEWGADIVRAASAALVCTAENAEELAAAILQMRNMPQEARQQMGAAGRRWYDKHFELKKLTGVFIGHFEETTSRCTKQRDMAND
jgi:glycosyltransferase involved in cell wall biosynthesis